MLARCAEAIRRTGDQIKTIKEENRELRKAGYNKPKMDKLKRGQEEEIKTKDEKIKQGKSERKMAINNITSLEEWTEDQKTSKGTKHDETAMPKESNKKDLEEKNKKIEENTKAMQDKIARRNSKITQLKTMKMELIKHNNHLIGLCIRKGLFEGESGTERKEDGASGRKRGRGLTDKK